MQIDKIKQSILTGELKRIITKGTENEIYRVRAGLRSICFVGCTIITDRSCTCYKATFDFTDVMEADKRLRLIDVFEESTLELLP